MWMEGLIKGIAPTTKTPRLGLCHGREIRSESHAAT